jgi:hypothetical protein
MPRRLPGMARHWRNLPEAHAVNQLRLSSGVSLTVRDGKETLPSKNKKLFGCLSQSADAQVGRFSGAFVGDEAQAVTLSLHHLAIAREYPVTGPQRAAEIAVRPGPGTAHIAAKGPSTNAARGADGQTDAQTGEAFATHEIDEDTRSVTRA